VYSTTGMSIHERTNAQREPKVSQMINKWWADSASPHLETQRWAAVDKIPRVTRLTFVDNLSRNRRHTTIKIIYFNFITFNKSIISNGIHSLHDCSDPSLPN
jgi:hypothetical protein